MPRASRSDWILPILQRCLAVLVLLALLIAPDVMLNLVSAFVSAFVADVVLHLIVQDRGRFFWTAHYLARFFLVLTMNNAIRRLSGRGAYSSTRAALETDPGAAGISIAEALATMSVMLFYEPMRVAASEVLAYSYTVTVCDLSTHGSCPRVRVPFSRTVPYSTFSDAIREEFKYTAPLWKLRAIYNADGRVVTDPARDMHYGEVYYIRKLTDIASEYQ